MWEAASNLALPRAMSRSAKRRLFLMSALKMIEADPREAAKSRASGGRPRALTMQASKEA
jgi:hypothetical protein